ncbi:MAG TPA: winged helix-turn-helix domain-containing protein [Pseudolabrys sp.]|nr:winged helix-turn-helix domain-containing protein [Pseudolabrys sp.]
MDFRFANFEIDLARHELRCDGVPVPVEPQVFDLLVHLVRNHSRIVTKDELVAVVWNGRAISDAALSSRVSAARRAVGDNGNDQKVIRTLNRRGFRFVAKVEAPARPPAAVRSDAPAPVASGKAAIAVLPFHNISGDPEQEILADGITEDVINGLSRQQWFSVVDRNSTFACKGGTVDVRRLACELGTRYVLEGSVRKAAGRIRITAQLVDATRRVHLWADRHDVKLAEIFDRQDAITDRIADSVGSQVILAEAMRLRRQPCGTKDARDLVTQALPHMWRMDAREQQAAQSLLQQASTLESRQERARAHALLGWTHVNMFNLESCTPINEMTEKALESGAKALSLNAEDHWGHLVLGLGHARRRRPEEAVSHLSRSVDLSPGFALGYAGLGYALACGGEPERGLQAVERARRISAFDPFLSVYAAVVRYMALFALERYEEAVAVCHAVVARHPKHAGAWRLMTVSLGLLGRFDEARESLARTLRLQSDLSADHVARTTVFAAASDRSRFLKGLQLAGLRG